MVVLALQPPPGLGERLSLRHRPSTGAEGDLVGYVVGLTDTSLTIEDARGRLHEVALADVLAARRVGVALGRRPSATPRADLDDQAARAGLAGDPELLRISDVLAGRRPPAAVFPERGTWASAALRARVEGEWLTTNATGADLIDVCWWATRQGARSVQVRPGIAG